MSSEFSLHPELASTIAWQVDGLYFLLVALSVVFAVGIFAAILIFAVITFRDSIGHWKSLQTRTGNRRQRVPGETMRLFHGFLSQIRMRLQGLPDLQRR